ncbi:hypothetical protein QQ056_17590 [Oscillatoria laete-virens NRMC-F 0139]|nr:hypothetical protein [Oscillatoria laete-virens]MDL5055348.1 hypothetical protein [Oscillatoria laete-virens NRMC-F 0139]
MKFDSPLFTGGLQILPTFSGQIIDQPKRWEVGSGFLGEKVPGTRHAGSLQGDFLPLHPGSGEKTELFSPPLPPLSLFLDESGGLRQNRPHEIRPYNNDPLPGSLHHPRHQVLMAGAGMPGVDNKKPLPRMAGALVRRLQLCAGDQAAILYSGFLLE